MSSSTVDRVADGKVQNRDVDWGGYPAGYLEQYGVDADELPIPGFTPLPEDQAHNREFIRIVSESPELVRRLGTASLLLDCCVGGVLRTSLLIAPFAKPEGAILELADLEGPQLEFTRRALANRLAGWQPHADNIAGYDTQGYWHTALDTVNRTGIAVARNIFELPRNRYQVTATGYGPESLTEDVDEWELAVNSLINATTIGGVFVMEYMDGSDGWGDFPAVSIGGRDVERVLAGKVRVIGHTFAPASGQAREEDDPTHYRGMGLAVGIVEAHA